MKRSRNLQYDDDIYRKILISDQIMADYMINLSLYNNKSNKNETCYPYNLVPFPQKPKVSGVIIEEINSESNIDKTKHQNKLIVCDELKYLTESLVPGDILPKSVLWSFNKPTISNALVLWKPIKMFNEVQYQDNINTYHNETKPNAIKNVTEDVEME